MSPVISFFLLFLLLMTNGWTYGEENYKPLKIGVPAMGAFNQFVKVKYDPDKNGSYVTGFSIQVFEAVVKRLPYQLPYVLVPFYGSYDDMVKEVHSQVRFLLALCKWHRSHHIHPHI